MFPLGTEARGTIALRSNEIEARGTIRKSEEPAKMAGSSDNNATKQRYSMPAYRSGTNCQRAVTYT